MSTPLQLAMQITANTQGVSAAVGSVNSKLDALSAAGRKAASDLSVLKTIEISRAFLSAVTSAASSFQSMVVGSASAVAAIDDLSKRTGVSSTALQAYQFAADQSGVSIETFGKSLQKLTINLGEAQTGNGAAIKAFTDLGLSVQELSTLSPQVAFEKIAASIAALPNPAQQAAAAVSLFGKSGVDLVPVFQEGAGFLQEMREEAERLGTVLSEDQVGALAGLDDSIAKVSASFKGLTSRVVAEFAPALTVAADQLSTFLGSLDARELVGNLSASLGNLSDVASALGSAFELVSAVFTPLAEVVFPVVAQTLGFLAANIEGAALGALLAAGAYAGYSLAAVTATGATVAFTAALRLLLASTGVGLLVVLLGTAAGAFLQYLTAGDQATTDVSASIAENNARIEELRANLQDASVDAADFGKEFQAAFKTPLDVTNASLTQGVVDEAGQAFRRLAADLGTVELVPQELLDAFELLKFDIDSANDGAKDAALAQQLIADSANRVLALIEKSNAARQEEKARIDDVVDGVRQAQEYEKRLKEEQRQRVDDITRRELEAQAQIEQRIADVEAQRLSGLRGRNSEPLRAADIRSSEGIGQFLALATGREDPALAESRKQTNEIVGLRQDLRELQAQKAEIMGGA
jgi:hypothetical protein